MNSEITPVNRKTGSIIAKCLIVLLVLGIVCSLSIWAWFTVGQTALANGINVQSKGDGVQVSWDGENYYDHLQALKQEDISGDAVGPALNISGVEGQPAPLSLVTGNGLQFFEPAINRRTGTVLYDGNDKTKNWYGVDIVDGENSAGKYIDIDLYFRSDTQRDVYLAGDSRVLPKSTDERLSEFGAFSKDNIASASRVAFLNSDKDKCAFIWAPNADQELIQDESGYKKYTTTATQDITISGGGNGKIDGGVEDNGRTYYLWTYWDNSVVSDYPQDLSEFEARKFNYDSERRYFVTTVVTYIPTYGNGNPSIPVFVNETDNANASNINQYNQYIDGAKSKVLNKDDFLNGENQYFGVTNTNFNVGNSNCSNAMYLTDSSKISAGSKITYEVGYDPVNKLLVVLNYKVEGGASFDIADEKTDITTTVTYYPLDNNVTCALVNPSSATAVSSGVNYKKAVSFTDTNKNFVSNTSIALSEQFISVKNGTGYNATYKFQNNSTKTYLTLTNGSVSLTAAGTEFTLEYKEGFSGPLLKAGDYYLVVDQGRVIGVKVDALDTDYAVTVYTGTTYDFVKVSQDNQTYQFYNNSTGKKTLESLDSTSNPKLFRSFTTSTASEKVGGTKIVSLTKENANAEYYTAHIVMRVWVEGTDREAKTPLADGIFNLKLHFTSQ